MDPRVTEILDGANDIQRRYVRARLIHPNTARAAHALGIHKSTPSKWSNLDELEEAVDLLYRDVIEAAKLALEDLALEAVQTLGRAIKGSSATSVNAANSILDRVGLPKQSTVEVAGGDKPVKIQVELPDEDKRAIITRLFHLDDSSERDS